MPKRKHDNYVKIKIGLDRFGKKTETVYEGDIYSKHFCEALRALLQKKYGTNLPPEFKKLFEPIR